MIAAVLFSVHLRGGDGSWEPVNGGEITGTSNFECRAVVEWQRGEEIWISDSRFGFGFGLGVEGGTTVHTF